MMNIMYVIGVVGGVLISAVLLLAVIYDFSGSVRNFIADKKARKDAKKLPMEIYDCLIAVKIPSSTSFYTNIAWAWVRPGHKEDVIVVLDKQLFSRLPGNAEIFFPNKSTLPYFKMKYTHLSNVRRALEKFRKSIKT